MSNSVRQMRLLDITFNTLIFMLVKTNLILHCSYLSPLLPEDFSLDQCLLPTLSYAFKNLVLMHCANSEGSSKPGDPCSSLILVLCCTFSFKLKNATYQSGIDRF